MPYCQEESKGLWVLLRTTNPKSDFLQLHGAETTSAEHLARALNKMGQSTVGASGFSSVGVVVGAMAAEEAQKEFVIGCHMLGFWFQDGCSRRFCRNGLGR